MRKKLSPECAKCPTVVCGPPIGATETLPLDKVPGFLPYEEHAGGDGWRL